MICCKVQKMIHHIIDNPLAEKLQSWFPYQPNDVQLHMATRRFSDDLFTWGSWYSCTRSCWKINCIHAYKISDRLRGMKFLFSSNFSLSIISIKLFKVIYIGKKITFLRYENQERECENHVSTANWSSLEKITERPAMTKERCPAKRIYY